MGKYRARAALRTFWALLPYARLENALAGNQAQEIELIAVYTSIRAVDHSASQ